SRRPLGDAQYRQGDGRPVHIVVLVKPVPDTASSGERLRPDGRLDRAAVPAVVNANDEYALEAALKLVEALGGEITIVSMAPAGATDTMRKALAMGATRDVLVTDEALEGADHVTTVKVLAAALSGLEYDLVLAGADTSDGQGGVVGAGVAVLTRPPERSSPSSPSGGSSDGRAVGPRRGDGGWNARPNLDRGRDARPNARGGVRPGRRRGRRGGRSGRCRRRAGDVPAPHSCGQR